ncbi:MAG: hypothetical protein ACTSW1_02505 [Candidatus Hodarchaeales archaeon]
MTFMSKGYEYGYFYLQDKVFITVKAGYFEFVTFIMTIMVAIHPVVKEAEF